jgi:ketosteroid isomerase-like protein
MDVSIPDDCGNSTRRKFLADFNLAFAAGDTAFIMEHVSDDIHWEMVGDKTVEGKTAMTQEVKTMTRWKTVSFTLHSVITHGREAAANGELHFAGGQRVAFCDVYTFKGAKGNTLQGIKSYGIIL